MSVARSLKYSCPPSESITLEDLKNFLYDATAWILKMGWCHA